MGTELKYIVQKIDTETILSKMPEVLKFLDPVLSANLDYAARAFTNMPLAYRSGALLCVAGTHALVKFVQGYSCACDNKCDPLDPDRSIRFTVFSEDGRPRLIRSVACGNFVNLSDIKEAHFTGHNCQDQDVSCFNQARNAVSSGGKGKDIHIICNSLSLTYSRDLPRCEQTAWQEGIYTLKTQCRLVVKGNRLTGLLEIRCWLEQEKPQKKGLLACLDHLLKQVAELPKAPTMECTFILQGDGEVVELLDSTRTRGREIFIFGGPNGVSMSPARWQ